MNEDKIQISLTFFKRLLLPLLVMTAIFSYILHDYITTQRSLRTTQIKSTRDILENTITSLDNQLATIGAAAQRLADKLNLKKMTDEQLLAELKSLCGEHTFIGAAGAALSKRVREPQALYAPLFVKQDATLKQVQINEFYDYTVSSWYQKAFAGKQQWMEPSFHAESNQLSVRLVTPFFEFDPETRSRKPIGTIVVDIPLDRLQEVANIPDLPKRSYAFLVSHQGMLLTYPAKEYVKSQNTIFDIARITRKKKLIDVGRSIVKGDDGIEVFYDENNRVNRFFYQPISSTNWSLVIISAEEISFTTSHNLRRKLIHCALAAMMLLILLSLAIFGCLQFGHVQWWLISAFASLFILLGIGFVWGIDLMSTAVLTQEGELVSTSVELNRFLDLHKRLNIRLYRTKPIMVPTGLFINSMSIESGSDLSVTGYLWQKYDEKHKQTLVKSV